MKREKKDVENSLPLIITIVVIAVIAIILTVGESLFDSGLVGKELPEEKTTVKTIHDIELECNVAKKEEERYVYTFKTTTMTMKEFLEKYEIEVTEENNIEKINISDDNIEIITPRRSKYPNITYVSLSFLNKEDQRREKATFELLVEE